MENFQTNRYLLEISRLQNENNTLLKRIEELLIQHELASQQIQIWEKRVEELESEVKELRNLHDAGCREAYKICGTEDDGEYRWKWVLLELSSRVNRIGELKNGIRKHQVRSWETECRAKNDEELYALVEEK